MGEHKRKFPKKPNEVVARIAYIEKPLYQSVDELADKEGVDTTGFLNALLNLGLKIFNDTKTRKEREKALIITPEEHRAMIENLQRVKR